VHEIENEGGIEFSGGEVGDTKQRETRGVIKKNLGRKRKGTIR